MSEADPIAAYQDALRKRDEAERKANRLAQYMVNAGEVLKNWRDVSFSNLSVSYPIGRRYSIIGDQWPTGLEIASALSEYHTAHHEAQNAYRRIPADKRSIITPPPEV
jgi:hypothetical protein